MELKYFTVSEFDSPDLERSGEMMNNDFLYSLDNVRDLAKIPFTVTSGYRTIEHNKSPAVGGGANSSHLRGLAADILCIDSSSREKIIRAAILCGFRRIGIKSDCIHLDNDPAKKPAIWLYP